MSALMRLALPVLAVASTAYAASCSITATATIENNVEASALATCTTFSGSIAVSTAAVDGIILNGIKKITGNLLAEPGSNITSLSGDSLESVGDFELQEVTKLSSISFPKLTTVKSINWINVAVLANLDFSAAISEAETIDIENTELRTLAGINLETVGDIKIANNRFIEEIAMQVQNITGTLIFEGNNAALVVKLDQLKAANSMTFQQCASVEFPALSSLSGSLRLLKNNLESFSAPNLTKVGNSLIVNDNPKLTNVSFPLLTGIASAFQIANNTLLQKIDGFAKLTTIGANLDLHGNFSTLALPALTDVKGTFNIQSTGDIQDTCDKDFKPKSTEPGGTKRFQGSYKCIGEVANPGGVDSTPTPTGNGAKKTNAASPLNVQNSALGLGLFAAFFL